MKRKWLSLSGLLNIPGKAEFLDSSGQFPELSRDVIACYDIQSLYSSLLIHILQMSNSTELLVSCKAQAAVCPSETETVCQGRIDLPFLRFVCSIVAVKFGCSSL